MTAKTEKVQVYLKYKELEQQFAAEPQEAWLLINQFFKNLVPSFEIAQKIWLNIDLQQLAKDLDSIVIFSSDGASLLIPKNKLTDNEALSLWLTAYYLGDKIGMVNVDALSKDELQIKLGKSGKIISTRLGELSKNGLVQKTVDEKFRITVMGVLQTQKEVIPKIKSKMKH
ncbi:MAG TPA: hypothetical protein VLU95_08150 [Candidatus Acidoferrum sp.]|nr:hypothetical protein [Candidatus Acidoferrum sp.]